MKKSFYLLTFVAIAYYITAFNLITLTEGEILYTDVTNINLPVSSVTGPDMDAEAADIDNDGDLDIIIAREFAPNKLLFNDGKGVFIDGTIGNLPQYNYDSEDIGIADFDNDNDLDIVFASEDNAVHEFYLNNGDGSFRDANNRLPNSIANAVVAQDINNDTKPDIILGNAGQDLVLINNGDTTFTNETSLRLPVSNDVTQDLKLADIDNDGDKDLIAGNEDGNKIYINNGSGIFSDESLTRLPPSKTEETRKVTLADIDDDNDLDLFFANVAFIPGRIRQDRLLINNGSGIFTDVTSTNLPLDNEQTMEGIFIDIDYDNDLDLITANIFFDRPMKVFSNNGSGNFTEVTNQVLPPNVIAEGIGLKAADFDNDDFIDIYLVNRKTPAQTGLSDRLLLRNDTGTVGINYNGNKIPTKYILYQNYPNPFNPTTYITYDIPIMSKNSKAFVQLKIYNTLGDEVVTLVKEKQNPGKYKVEFNANRHGQGINLSSGVYYFSLEIEGEFKETKKMLLVK